MRTKDAFNWSKNQVKQQYFEILLQFERTIFSLNVFWNVIYFHDAKTWYTKFLIIFTVIITNLYYYIFYGNCNTFEAFFDKYKV